MFVVNTDFVILGLQYTDDTTIDGFPNKLLPTLILNLFPQAFFDEPTLEKEKATRKKMEKENAEENILPLAALKSLEKTIDENKQALLKKIEEGEQENKKALKKIEESEQKQNEEIDKIGKRLTKHEGYLNNIEGSKYQEKVR